MIDKSMSTGVSTTPIAFGMWMSTGSLEIIIIPDLLSTDNSVL